MGKSYVTMYSRYPVNIEGQVGGWIENVLKFESFDPIGFIFSAKVGRLLKRLLSRQASDGISFHCLHRAPVQIE